MPEFTHPLAQFAQGVQGGVNMGLQMDQMRQQRRQQEWERDLGGVKVLMDYAGTKGATNTTKANAINQANGLLMKYYGDTMALSKGAAIANVSFDKSAYFFSEIRTEQNEDGEIIPRLVSEKGSHLLDYSYGEYRAFIERFREIARKMPDEVKEEQEFRGVKG